MKRIAFAAALAAACAVASAQPPGADVPKHKCEPVPQLPAPALMKEKMVRQGFERDLKQYKECITGYVDQRSAAIKANQEAANAAINEYNGVMKALNEAHATDSGPRDASPGYK